MMKALKLAICAALLAVLLAPCAMAAPAPLSGLACAADAQGNYISLQWVDGERWLFLPSTVDLTALTFKFEGGPAALTAGARTVTVTSGQPFDLAALYPEAPGSGVYAFTLRAGSVQLPVKLMASKNIGAMYITSDDPVYKGRSYVELDKSNKATGQMTLVGADGGLIYSGNLTQIKGRGNTTWTFYPKKPYQIKLGKKTDLLETGDPNEAAKTWVLLANYYDTSFMLNTLTFDLADALGLPYSPHSRPIDLYYDGEYRGTYLLSEKTEIKGGRVDIHDLEGDFEDANPQVKDFDSLPTAWGVNAYGNAYQYVTGLTDPADITGGYLLEMDFYYRAWEEKSYFTTSQGYYIVSKSPEYLSRTAMEYISRFYQEFEDAVWNGGINPMTGKSYTDYVDLESLAKCYVILELSQDGDAFGSSTFFYKPAGEEKLYAGPVWDFDSAYGGFISNFGVTEIVAGATPIGRKLLEIPSLKQAVDEVYETELNRLVTEVILSTDPNTQSGRLRSIPGYSAETAASLRMDDVLWPYQGSGISADVLRNFISRRNEYLHGLYYAEIAEDPSLFSDVPESIWYYPAVEYVVEKGLFAGTGERTFSPDGTMTRAMAATVLYRQAGSPAVEGQSSFSDVPQDRWYADAVAWASGAGVVKGYPDGLFYPGREITVQELVTMLYRYAVYSGVDVTAPEKQQYLDWDSVADWAADAFAWAMDRGIISGLSPDGLDPGGNALRYMTAVIFQRYNEMLEAEITHDASHISAEIKVSAGLYNGTEISEAAAVIPAGTRVQVEETADPFWCLVILDDAAQKQWGVAGAEWYMYAENLCRVENNKAADTTIFEEYVAESFHELKEIFPHGKYWNHTGLEISVSESSPYYVTDTPCTHFVSDTNGYDYSCKYCNRYISAGSQFIGTQCVGFANLLGDEIFGENAPVHSYRDLNRLRVGDYIRYSHSIGYHNGFHTITVTGIYDTYITVAEVNRNFETCEIEWDRKIDYTELENIWDITCYTRYPFAYTGTGYIPW